MTQRAVEKDTSQSSARDGGGSSPARRRALGYGLLVVLPLLAATVLLVSHGDRPARAAAGSPDNHAAAALFFAIAVVVGAARLAGLLAARLGQPQVIGELLAGITLGPTVLDRLAPSVRAWLFPQAAVTGINALAQLGLVLFMFGVGQEVVRNSRDRAGRDGGLIALTSLVLPFAAGTAIALPLASRFAGAAGDSLTFALFVGCALSITAFPVLARILTDLDLIRTRTGRLSLFSAAIGDGICWLLLTATLLLAQGGDLSSLWRPVLLTLLTAVVLLGPVRAGLARYLVHGDRQPKAAFVLMIAVVGIAGSAGITALLGIHQLIGAFLFGLAWPAALPPETSVVPSLGTMAHLLLPFFFLGFGVSVDLGDLPLTTETLAVACLLTAVAIVTKVGGVALAAHLCGMGRREAATLGLLMNARGLTELVVLGIGHEARLIDGEMFAMLTLVALVTTLMTGPGVRLLAGLRGPGREPTP
ncbi:Na(+)_H(+)-K(+) antiporter GerN [Streptomyces sp. enrichment culture]|uniref:cation:proton antiporter domain-containing protein n=1 Tax=Streptomyces sp. enrichment culture TaxID=1795815 RepID=UPI003F547582